MKYKYSICHPDKEEIEYSTQILSASDVKKIAESYPWEQELMKLARLKPEEVCYNPSLDFTNLDNSYSFCLTVEGMPTDYSFSVWYNRPKSIKPFFGLFGKRVKFKVIDKRFTIKESFELLNRFLNNDYQFIENKMNES